MYVYPNRQIRPVSSELNNILASKPVHQALQLALYRGRASVARTLLAQCEDVNATGGHFGNLIQAAAFGGHETMVRWLIDLGADIHVRGRYGSPLRAASLGGHDAVVRLLLNHGARTDKAEDNALQAAALNGHFATLKLLISHSEEACNWSACYESALEAASSKAHLEIVQCLLQNRPGRFGTELEGSALEAAVISGQESVVNMLIEEIPQLRRIGRTMYVRCSLTGTLDLLPPKPQATPCPEPPSSIKDGGADFASIRPCDTMTDPSDWDSLTNRANMHEPIAIPATDTPTGQEYLLRMAAGQGSKRMVEHLMACGFELNEVGNVNGNLSHQPTALEVAAEKSELDIVDLLLRRGANLGKALHFAVRHGKLDVVRLLLAYRPEAELDCFIDPVELQGQYQRVVDPVEPVVPQGLVLPTPRRDMSNRSPLAIAVEWGHDEIVSALLRHKAKSRHPGIGLSMLVAARNGCDGMIHVFMEYGRATNGSMDSKIISDFLLEQSIREASANGHLYIVKVLLEQSNFYEHSRYIFIAMCEARMHGHNGILVDLRTLAPLHDSHRLLGLELAAVASTRPIQSSITPYLEPLLDRLSSERVDSQLCTIFIVNALRDALKTGQYEAARFLLEKDESCRVLETETDILHFAIRTMWINDFSDGRDSDYGDALTHRDLLDLFIKHGASTESFDSLGNTPLFYACSNPIPGVFDMLIESKASPWTKHALRLSDGLESTVSCQGVGDANKSNLLNVALQSRIEKENIETLTDIAQTSRKDHCILYLEWEKIIVFLLDLGMPFDLSDPSLISFLHVVCLRGRLECVQRLAKGGVNFHAADHCPKKYFLLGTALHAAVIGGQLEVLRYLLEIGVDVRQKAVSLDLFRGGGLIDETATQTAVRATENAYSWRAEDHWDVLRILLEFWDGMDDYTTALHAATRKEKVEIIDLLLRRCTKVPDIPLCQNVEIVKLFIKHGITIILPADKMMGWHEEAIDQYNVPLLELLIAQSSLLLPDPLSHLRAWSIRGDDRHLNMVQFLLERYNCDINATFRRHRWFLDVEYDTNTLLEARLDRGEKTMRFLLEHGADPDGPGLADSVLAALFRHGNCHFMYELPTIPQVRLLLDYGADINGSKTSPIEAEKHPRTLQPPLIRAIEEKDFPMVEFLVSNGADVNATSGPETPLHLARREGYGEIAEYLRVHGAIDRYEKGEMGRRVLERPGLTPVTTESLRGYDKLRL